VPIPTDASKKMLLGYHYVLRQQSKQLARERSKIQKRKDSAIVMTHKYRGCIVVLSINKTVKPNEEQKVLTSDFDQGFTINTSKQVFRGIW
jgi:hypothetical protein